MTKRQNDNTAKRVIDISSFYCILIVFDLFIKIDDACYTKMIIGLLFAYRLLLTAYCLSLIAYRLPLTAYRLSLIAYRLYHGI
jgi:hypothetical protein